VRVSQADQPHLVAFRFFDGQFAGLREGGDGAFHEHPFAFAFGTLRYQLHQLISVGRMQLFGAKRHQIKERAVTCRVHICLGQERADKPELRLRAPQSGKEEYPPFSVLDRLSDASETPPVPLPTQIPPIAKRKCQAVSTPQPAANARRQEAHFSRRVRGFPHFPETTAGRKNEPLIDVFPSKKYINQGEKYIFPSEKYVFLRGKYINRGEKYIFPSKKYVFLSSVHLKATASIGAYLCKEPLFAPFPKIPSVH